MAIKSILIFILFSNVGIAVGFEGGDEPPFNSSTSTGCSYSATCTTSGIEGVCVSISAGCCTGTVTSNLCSGSSDIKCCTNSKCSTPSGSGTCMQTSKCTGTPYPGYCTGPSDLQCCVKGGSGSTCTCNQYNMCTNIPADNNFYLTSFCDSSVACGAFSGNCNEYYSADYSRFGCNSVISCCQGSDCLNLKVIDGGPSCDVENKAGKPVIDASYSTCKHFTGSTSCGWSDHVPINCKKTSYTLEDTIELGGIIPLGPCSYSKRFSQDKLVPLCGSDFLIEDL